MGSSSNLDLLIQGGSLIRTIPPAYKTCILTGAEPGPPKSPETPTINCFHCCLQGDAATERMWRSFFPQALDKPWLCTYISLYICIRILYFWVIFYFKLLVLYFFNILLSFCFSVVCTYPEGRHDAVGILLHVGQCVTNEARLILSFDLY